MPRALLPLVANPGKFAGPPPFEAAVALQFHLDLGPRRLLSRGYACDVRVGAHGQDLEAEIPRLVRLQGYPPLKPVKANMADALAMPVAEYQDEPDDVAAHLGAAGDQGCQALEVGECEDVAIVVAGLGEPGFRRGELARPGRRRRAFEGQASRSFPGKVAAGWPVVARQVC